MNFKLINKDGWERNQYYNHYFFNVPCTYSMTVKLDITNIKNKNIKLYPAMLYFITTIVNLYEEFRTAIHKNGEVGIYSEMSPSYTIFNKKTKIFSNIWTLYNPDLEKFCDSYEKDVSQYFMKDIIEAKTNKPENTFPISMIPWTTFDGFNLNIKNGYECLLPIFTMGKYYKHNEKFFMPLSIQVHHAVCDGFHLCRFINDLQELIKKKYL